MKLNIRKVVYVLYTQCIWHTVGLPIMIGSSTGIHVLTKLLENFVLQLEGHMNDLCSQQNLLGRLGQHYLIISTVKGRFPRSTVTQQSQEDYHLRPRLTLRTFASYRTLLILLLLYSLGSLFSISPLFSTCLILMLSFLYGLCMTVYVGK